MVLPGILEPPGRVRIITDPYRTPKEPTMIRIVSGIRTLRTSDLAALLGGTFLLLALLAALLTGPLARAQDDSPTAAVRSVVETILEILRKPDFDMARDRPAISAEVKRAFDATAMAQSVLSTNWRDATAAQQAEFRDLLLQTIENTYLGRIQAYTNETVEFRSEEINDTRASVDTVILAANNEIPVNYRLRKRSDGWFVYDVEVENVSMVSSYRETYRDIVNRSGMDGLLEQLRAKAGTL